MAKTKIRVLKPFHLSMLPAQGKPRQEGAVPEQAREIVFTPGDHEVEEEVANHPYIKSLADGKIESVTAAKARAESEAAAAAEAERAAAIGKAQAEAAVERFTKKAATEGAASGAAITEELNTPVSQLRKTSAK